MANFSDQEKTTNDISGSFEQQKKLFIGGLNSATSDDQLKEYCSKFGQISECSIIRDKTGRSRNFAFVSFQDRSSLDEFMKQRPHMIDERKIEVRRAMPRWQTSKSETHSAVKKIFVGAIPMDLTENDLKSHFETFGNIVECHIMKDKEDRSRGFAFITYDDYDAVDRCILEKPHVIQGKEIDVQKAIPRERFDRIGQSLVQTSHFIPPEFSLSTATFNRSFSSYQNPFYNNFSKPMPLMNSNSSLSTPTNLIFNPVCYPSYPIYATTVERISPNQIRKSNRTSNKPKISQTNGSNSIHDEHNRKLFIGGLSAKTTDETLKNYVLKFGEVSDCLVMKDQNGQSKCFGFVTFVNVESVEELMKNRPHVVDGRQIDPKRAMPREEAQNDEIHLSVKKIFLGGIRDGLDEEILRNYFQQFGNIVECLIMQNQDGKLRGFAFIEFDDYDSVDKAILARPHVIGEHRIDVKKAIPKENRSQIYQNQINSFDLAGNNPYYHLNPLFQSNFYSPSIPLVTSYGPSVLNENFSNLHLFNEQSFSTNIS